MKNVSNKQLARLRSLGYSAAKDCSTAGTVIKYLKEILQTVTIQSQHASALLLKCRFQHRCLQIYKSWTCSRGHYHSEARKIWFPRPVVTSNYAPFCLFCYVRRKRPLLRGFAPHNHSKIGERPKPPVALYMYISGCYMRPILEAENH